MVNDKRTKMNAFPEVIDESTAPTTHPDAHATPRILVADDESSMREFVTEVLISCGYEADSVEGGIEALEALHHIHYDMLVTDINMPNGSGTDLVMKMHSEGMFMPVIMMTGCAINQELSTLTDMLHVNALLSKPFSMDDLLKAVESSLPLDHHPLTDTHPAVPRVLDMSDLPRKPLDQ